MRILTQIEFDLKLKLHAEWLSDITKGEQLDLRYADLSYADLSYADLPQNTQVFTFNKDTGIYINGMLRIGCQYHSIEHWVDKSVEIGKEAGYSDLEIELYTIQILVLAQLHREGKI